MAASVRTRSSASPPRKIKKLSTRLNNIRKRSQKSITRTIGLFCRPKHQDIVTLGNIGTFCRTRSHLSRTLSRPLSRSSMRSIASYRDLGAYNRISMMSTENLAPLPTPLRYSIHQADNDDGSGSPARSISTMPEVEDRIQEVSADLPCAAEYQAASENYEFIPAMKKFAVPAQQILPSESWDKFLGRVFQPDACTPSMDRLSQTELLSPVLGRPNVRLELQGSDSSDSDNENISTVRTAQYARLVKGASLVRLHRRNGKMISEPAPKFDHLAAKSAAARDSMFEKPIQPLSISKSRSAPELKTTKVELKHNTLPYLAYGEPFNPFDAFSVHSSPASTLGHKSLEMLPSTTYVPPKPATDLHLDQASIKAASTRILSPTHSSWLDLTDNEDEEDTISAVSPVEEHENLPTFTFTAPSVRTTNTRGPSKPKHSSTGVTTLRPLISPFSHHPQLRRDRSSGVLTRRITNACEGVPGRFLMIDHYPLFTRPASRRTEKTASRPSSKTVQSAPAASARRVFSAPVPAPLVRPHLTRDRGSGVLTRRITDARSASVPGRVVMVDHYPLFRPEIPKRSSSYQAYRPASTSTTSTTTSTASTEQVRGSTKKTTPSPLRKSFLATDVVMAQNDDALAALEGKTQTVFFAEQLRGSEARQEETWAQVMEACDRMGIY